MKMLLLSILQLISFSTFSSEEEKSLFVMDKTMNEVGSVLNSKSSRKCPCSISEDTPLKTPFDESSVQSEKFKAFIDLQFLATEKSGEEKYKRMRVHGMDYYYQLSKYARENYKNTEDVMKLPEDEIRKILMGRSTSAEGQEKKDLVDNLILMAKIAKVAATGDVDGAHEILRNEMSNESFGKKISFLSNFLSNLRTNYDFSMLGDGPNSKKTVTDLDMLSSLNQSMQNGIDIPTGVCRHMHQLAVRFARDMGLKDSYGVSYKSVEGDGHMTMVITAPNDSTKVVQLNYEKVYEKESTAGPQALSQNHDIPSVGIKLTLWNEKNEHAITLPSEAGMILNLVTGGKDKDLSPNLQSKIVTNQAGITTPYGVVRFFHAEAPAGNQTRMLGGSYNVKVNYNDVFYGEYGVAGFSSERPVQGGVVKEDGIYGRTTQGFNWKFYKTDNASLAAFGELHLRGSATCFSVQKDSKSANSKCKWGVDHQEDLVTGLRANYLTGPVLQRTSFLFQTQGIWNSSFNDEHYELSIPIIKLTHDIDFKIASSIEGNVGGDVTLYALGSNNYLTYGGHTGVKSLRTGTYFGTVVQGRLTKDTPIWIPGSEHSVSGVINQSIFGNRLYVGVNGRKSFDLLEDYFIGLNIGGSL